ncbi:MAG: DUF167 domain-containing protein [Candidatus Paceibacterota bacterium]|jgi:uncharacterized protein YggU (UPF0235/DUF167 family)
MYIHVKATTGANKEEIKKISADHFEISVKEPAKQNLANKRIIALVQKMYPNTLVRIINGHHSRSKLISVEEND